MSRHVWGVVTCLAAVAAGFLLRALDRLFVILGATAAVAGIVGGIVLEYREAQRGRPKPPWPPDDSAGF